jgi:NAD(P)-dependent dehydrogenase (short-subunit alcohol dehydrogenase family)
MAAGDATAGPGVAGVPGIEELFDLRGRVAVVTGAGSGIGRAVARRLALCGARVLATDLSEEGAGATVAEVARLGSEGRALVADVRRPEDADRTAAAALDAWGRLDVLVNNAGIYPAATVLDASPELWDDVLRINTIGVFLTSRACAKAMAGTADAPGGGGAIVNLASKSAFQPTRGMAHYAASKAGVAMLTKALALELAPLGIRVNAVAPGAIRTEGSARAAAGLGGDTRSAADVVAAFQARCPLGREGDPDEIARVVLFLATPASAYMTGSVVVADGGYLLT